MVTTAQAAARPLPRTGQQDLRSQYEKDLRLEWLRSQVAFALKDYSVIDGIFASNASAYHRLQMLLGIGADRGYCALLTRKDCSIVSNSQLLNAVCSFVPELATSIASYDYAARAEALKTYLRYQHESRVRRLLQQLFAGDLKRTRKSPAQGIYVRSTCAGCLRPVSVSFKQGPKYICKHCLPLWFETSPLYMSQQEVDDLWLGFPIGHIYSCAKVDTRFTTATMPITYHTKGIQQLAPQVHQGLSLAALQSGQVDRGQLGMNYIQAILAFTPVVTEQQAITIRQGITRLYHDANALDVFDIASVSSGLLQQAHNNRSAHHPTFHALHQLTANGGHSLSRSGVTSKQVRETVEHFERSVTGERYYFELMLDAADCLGGIARPDLIDYLASVVDHATRIGASARDILLQTRDHFDILLEHSIFETILKTARETWNEWITLLEYKPAPLNPSVLSPVEGCDILNKLLSIGLGPTAIAKLWIHLAVGLRLRKAMTSFGYMNKVQGMLRSNSIMIRFDKPDNIPIPAWIDTLLVVAGDEKSKIQVIRGSASFAGAYVSPTGNLDVYPELF